MSHDTIPLLGIYLRENKTNPHKDMHAGGQKLQIKCLATGEWIKWVYPQNRITQPKNKE